MATDIDRIRNVTMRDTRNSDTSIWRPARRSDWPRISEMCIALNDEDPGESYSLGSSSITRTLAELSANPLRGKAVVLAQGADVVGYALLISFWSNEFGGEICALDELFIMPDYRSQGHASQLITMLSGDPGELWPRRAPALVLETRRANAGSRKLYERHGFRISPTNHMFLVLEAA